MFEISDLKAKKLPELQEIAKGLSVPKFKTLKKLDLVYQILDLQAADPKAVAEVAPAVSVAEKKEKRPPQKKGALGKRQAQPKAETSGKSQNECS